MIENRLICRAATVLGLSTKVFVFYKEPAFPTSNSSISHSNHQNTVLANTVPPLLSAIRDQRHSQHAIHYNGSRCYRRRCWHLCSTIRSCYRPLYTTRMCTFRHPWRWTIISQPNSLQYHSSQPSCEVCNSDTDLPRM